MPTEITNASVSAQRQMVRNRTAVGFMLLAVTGTSLSPLVVALSGASQSPFLFNGGWRLGTLIAYIVFLAAFYMPLIRSRETLSLIARRTFSWTMLIIVLVNFDFALFVWSTQFIDISVAAMLFEIWPIILIFLMLRLLKDEGRYRKVTSGSALLLTISFIGFVFVVFSEGGPTAVIDSSLNLNLAIGILLVVAAVIAASLTAFSFKWGSELSRDVPTSTTEMDRDSVELFSIITAFVISNVIATPVTTLVGFTYGESLSLKVIGIGIAGGMFINAVSSIFWRRANLITDNLGVNALWYVTPILGLLWLAVFSQVNVVRPDYLIIGAAAIITANLLINFEAEVRLGFKSLIIALWVCNVFVYLRPVSDNLLIIDEWTWIGASYFEALALSATVFTLILSFRVARLVNRTTDEDNRTFALFQKLDYLVRRNVVSANVRQHLLIIDTSEQKPQRLRAAYKEVMDSISEANTSEASLEDRRLLSEATAELNSLVHSKQHGLVIGELFALYIFAGISVFIVLFARPDVVGWTAFLVEMFAALFSAVVIFLIFNVHDLQRERIAAILKQSKQGGYRVVFRDIQTRAFEQWLSVIIILTLIAGYGWLLWGKWLG